MNAGQRHFILEPVSRPSELGLFKDGCLGRIGQEATRSCFGWTAAALPVRRRTCFPSNHPKRQRPPPSSDQSAVDRERYSPLHNSVAQARGPSKGWAVRAAFIDVLFEFKASQCLVTRTTGQRWPSPSSHHLARPERHLEACSRGSTGSIRSVGDLISLTLLKMSPERQPPHPVTDRLFQLYDVLVDVTRKPAPT
jgi:hypothetical protein